MNDTHYYENPNLWQSDKYKTNNEQKRFAEVLAHISPNCKSILDVGAGNGEFLHLLERSRPSCHLAGVERARAAAAAKVCATPIEIASIDALPYPTGSFDCVTALEVIEHLPFGIFERGLIELQRVSSHYIVISVPYCERRKVVKCTYCGCRFNPNYHMRSFGESFLATLLHNFRLEKLTPIKTPSRVLKASLNALTRGLLPPNAPAHAICPQCGFKPSSNSEPSVSHSWSFGLRAVWPTINRPHWYVAAYSKVGEPRL